jgi:hypothetical protein
MTLVRLAPLALVALLAASCGDNDKKSATPATTAAATTTATTTTTTTTTTGKVPTGPSEPAPIPAKPSSKGNRLLLGTRDLYPLLAGSLSRYAPNQVRGKSVNIVELAGTDSFWAGRNAKQRILVKLNLKGGKGPVPNLQVGRQADFVGGLTRVDPARASLLGVKDKSGQAVLQNQGVYVLVSVGDLKLH